MNNRGFTLVELLVTLVLIVILISIGSFSIVKVMEASKKKDYELLVDNIKGAVELYYQECTYSKDVAVASGIDCGDNTVTLGELVTYGFLKGNSEKSETLSLVNPKDNANIFNCKISYSYSNGKITVQAIDDGSCPVY